MLLQQQTTSITLNALLIIDYGFTSLNYYKNY